MAPFQIGDRVICIAPDDGNADIVGMTGIVCGELHPSWCAVRYDEPFSRGHSCNGTCDSPYGWETLYEHLQPYEEPAPVISLAYEELGI